MATRLPKIRNRQRELGLGKNITTTGRLINPDGSFNVVRHHDNLFDNLYYWLISIPAWHFFGLIFLVFGAMNALFATVYLFIGDGALSGMPETLPEQWKHAFFFSSQTLTTVGYGHISPTGLGTNVIASIESFMGLLLFALISGLLYGRFSRPAAKIRFSDQMLIAPYKEGTGLMVRLVNPRASELIEVEASISLAINQIDSDTGATARRFFSIELEISKIAFFPLSWTLVHAIDEKSPLWGLSEAELLEANAEVMILIKGTDEATVQNVHARRSYISNEIVWNARFAPIMERSPNLTHTIIHTRKVGDFEYL